MKTSTFMVTVSVLAVGYAVADTTCAGYLTPIVTMGGNVMESTLSSGCLIYCSNSNKGYSPAPTGYYDEVNGPVYSENGDDWIIDGGCALSGTSTHDCGVISTNWTYNTYAPKATNPPVYTFADGTGMWCSVGNWSCKPPISQSTQTQNCGYDKGPDARCAG